MAIGGAAPELVALGGGATTVRGDPELAAALPWLLAEAALPVEPDGDPPGEVEH